MKFKSDIEVQAGLKDSSGSAGTSGQILSSTASGVSWINQISLSGYVPYTGATTNVDLGTHTLLANDLVINHSSGSGVAASITKGGNGEALTINKTSGSGNAMSVTGGLTSLVDLTLSSITNATTDTDKFIVSDSGLIKYRTGAEVLSDIGGQAALTNPITGTGTTNYVSKFTGTTTLGNSQIFDNGTNVGIGTTNPDTLLHISSLNSSILRLESTNTALGLDAVVGEIQFEANDASGTGTGVKAKIGAYSDVAAGNAVGLRFFTGEAGVATATEKMRISATGNVGIGTTNPTYKTSIVSTSVGTINTVMTLWNQDSSAGTGARLLLQSGTSDNQYGAAISSVNEQGSPSFQNAAIIFQTMNNTSGFSNLSERMRIASSGNVGIGTTNPTYKLHVVGDGYFSSNLTANNIYATQVCNTSTCNNASVALTSSGARITRNIADSNTAFAVTQTNASSTGAIQTWNNSAGEKMRIAQGGNVGIGTTNPTAIGTNITTLDIKGSTGGGVRSGVLGGSESTFYTIAVGGYLGTISNIPLNFQTNNSVKATILANGNFGIGTTSPSALLDVAGDALINGVTVGRGGGNDNSNTVVGRNSFANNSSGTENTVIGANAGNDITTGNANVIIGKVAGAHIDGGNGNTIIGTNNSLPPTTAPTDFSDTLSISKGESNFGVYLPHIWAPANVATSSTATIISAAVGAYRAMFVEYVIEDENGNIRGGYIKGIWNSDLSVIKMTEDTTSSIGVTADYVFDIVDDGSSNAALQITSLSTDIIYCAVTSRLLTRVY